MKYLQNILLLLCTLSCAVSYAQGDSAAIVTFHDYFWKNCDKDIAHYYRIKTKEGNWWHVKDFYIAQNQLQKEVVYSDDSLTIKQGMTYYFYPDGHLQKKVRYTDNKMEGMVKEYNTDGKLIDSALYKKNIPYKTHLKWDDQGNVKFKGVYDENGFGEGEEWEYYADGKVASHGKTKVGHMRDSVWTFYRTDGIVSCQDYYDNGQKMGRMCYDATGTLYTGACEDAPASFVEKDEVISNRFGSRYGDMKEANYKINQDNGSMAGTVDANYKFKKGTYIVMKIFVDEKGKMTKIDVMHHVHPQVDKMVVDIFSNISKFKPATNGNRNVASSFEYPFPLGQF